MSAPMVLYKPSQRDRFLFGGTLGVTIFGMSVSVDYKAGERFDDVVQRMSAKLVDVTEYRRSTRDRDVANAELQQMVRDLVLKRE